MKHMTLPMHVIAVTVSVPLFTTQSPPLGIVAAEPPRSLSLVAVSDAVSVSTANLGALQALDHAHALRHALLVASVIHLAATTVHMQSPPKSATLSIRPCRRINVRVFSKPQ